MASQSQIAKWEIEFIKAKNTNQLKGYAYSYCDAENPYFFQALDLMSAFERKQILDYYMVSSVGELNRNTMAYAKEYNACGKQKDYENYYVKYNGVPDNPFVEKAKEQIIIRNGIPVYLRIVVMILLFGVSGALMYASFLGDGTTNGFIAFLCIICMLLSIACFVVALIFVFNPGTFFPSKTPNLS